MFRADDAIKVVGRCRERGVRILGIDAFILTNKTTQPDMGQSLDPSILNGHGGSPDCWETGIKFLKERSSADLFFEIVIDEKLNR